MIYDIVRATFGIKRIVTPAFRVIYNLGFATMDEAEKCLLDLQLIEIDTGPPE